MSILVLGATGRIGLLAVQALAAAGRPVRGLVRDAAKAQGLWPEGVQAFVGDLADPASLAPALRGAEALLVVSPVHPMLVPWQCGAVQAAAEAGVRRIVKLSGSSWTLPPHEPTTVGAAHAQIEARLEALAQSHGIERVCIRPNAFLQGMLGRVAAELQAGDAFSLSIGEAQVSFADVRDIAAACVQALVAGSAGLPASVEVTGPRAVGGADIAALLQQLLKRPIGYRPIGVDEAVARARAAGASEFTLVHQREVIERLRAGAASAVSPAFEALCGQPPRGPEPFLAEALA